MNDDLSELFYTDEYEELLRRLERVAVHYERDLIDACGLQPVEDIRWKAGRVNGVRLALDMLTRAREHG